MSLTSQDIAVIRKSFARVLPKNAAVAKDFYNTLFEVAPSVRELFPEKMGRQREKLMSLLAYVVKHLDDGPKLLAEVEPLARRHVGYGAEEVHYQVVGKVLVDTLKTHGLSEEEEQTWLKVYAFLSGAMLKAAATAEKAPPPVLIEPID